MVMINEPSVLFSTVRLMVVFWVDPALLPEPPSTDLANTGAGVQTEKTIANTITNVIKRIVFMLSPGGAPHDRVLIRRVA